MRCPSRPDRVVLAVIATFTLLRLLLAGTVGLGVDGDYTVSVAHDLDLSFSMNEKLQIIVKIEPGFTDRGGVLVPRFGGRLIA